MYKELLDKIKEFDSIVIYRHTRPDGDAVFSQFALYNFIKDNFKNKKVELYGIDEYDLFPYKNIVKKETIEKSLAIVLDTATSIRANDDSFKYAKYIIKIDHHPSFENYGYLNIVDDTSAATCELLANILLSKEFEKYIFSKDVAKYLYSGILTDTNCFRTASTTQRTLKLASKLVEKGDFDISALTNYLFNKPIKDFKKITKLRNKLVIKDNVGYIIANKKMLKELNMTLDEIKNNIDEFNSIKGLKIWAVFAYNKDTNLYDASLRSTSKYVINTLCYKYNGGGHKNACGIKGLSLKEVKEVIKGLIHIANK